MMLHHPHLLVAFCALALSCAPAAAQVVAGRVVDAASGAGVAHARVVVSATDRDDPRRAATGDDGRFAVLVGGHGEYRVRVAREGYREMRLRPRVIGANDTLWVEVRMTPAALPLGPLTATARQRHLRVAGVFRDTVASAGAGPGPVTASGVRKGILVHGHFAAPSPCYVLAGVAVRTLQLVTLYVVARPNGNACGDAQGAFTYKVTVGGLSPGAYTLHVVHTVLDSAWPETMPVDTAVTVQ